MVGENSGIPTEDSSVASPPKLISFQCPQCGSSVPVYVEDQSLTFACPACAAIIQSDHEGAKILIATSQASTYKSLLELGSKADFRGSKWQVIGYMARSDEHAAFFWNEYLLYNPYEGFRFLMEAEGHWNFMSVTKKVGKTVKGSNESLVSWGGASYKKFHQGEAIVQFVLGEFYWRVKVGDRSEVIDYVAPPDLLSWEKSDGEIVWTSGVYVPREDIQKSFSITEPMPHAVGVAPNQPSKYFSERKALVKVWAAFVVTLIAIQLFFVARSSNRTILKTAINLSERSTSFKTPSFEVKSDQSNIEIDLHAPVMNSWVDAVGTVIPEQGQTESFGFRKEIAVYKSDEDGIDGDQRPSLFFPRMAKGLYHINFEFNKELAAVSASSDDSSISTAYRTLPFFITVREDPPLQGVFWIALGLLSLFPLFHLKRGYDYEKTRWSNSNQAG